MSKENSPEDGALTLGEIQRCEKFAEERGFFQQDFVDTHAMMGLPELMEEALRILPAAGLHCFAATHFYPHDKKRTPDELAEEYGTRPRVISDIIELAKSEVISIFRRAGSPLMLHPLLRIRTYGSEGRDAAPTAPLPEVTIDKNEVSRWVARMSSVLFDAPTHFAVCAYYLSGTEGHKTAGEIAEILGLTKSGVYQKLTQARDVLKTAVSYEPQFEKFNKHPMFSGEDPYYSNRKLAGLIDESKLDLSTRSAQLLFERASKLGLRHLIPLARTHFYAATEKQPLAAIAKDMDLSLSAVEVYVLEARDKLYELLEGDPVLLRDHPIIRPKRRYPMQIEFERNYDPFTPADPALLSQDDLECHKWASVLLNRQAYHLVMWGLGYGKRGLKGAFEASVSDISEWMTYSNFVVTMRTARDLAIGSEMIEQSLFGRSL